MARNRNLATGDDSTEINISPMIDMVFILLIFFIVTTVFVDEQGIGAEKPVPSSEPQDPQDNEPILLRITETSEVLYKGESRTMSQITQLVRDTLAQRDVPINLEVETGVQGGILVRTMDAIHKVDGAKINLRTTS